MLIDFCKKYSSYIPLKEKLIFYKKASISLVKSSVLRVIAFVTFCSFYIPLKEKLIFYKKVYKKIVKSMVLRVAKIEHFIVSHYIPYKKP